MWDKKRSYTKYNWKIKGVVLTDKFKDYDELYDYYLECKCCEICGIPFDSIKKCLDHNHDTGFFRAILCNSCNRINAKGNRNNDMGIKYISRLVVKKNGSPAEVYRIQFRRKGFKFFHQVRTDKCSLEEVIKIRNDNLITIDGNLNSLQ